MRRGLNWDRQDDGVLSTEDPRQVLYEMPALTKIAGAKDAQDLWGDAMDWSRVNEAKLARVLDRLPAFEADLIELTRQGCGQDNLAIVFGLSQAGISYRLRHAIETLKFWVTLPEFTEQQIRQELCEHIRPEWVDCLTLFHRTLNMSGVSRLLGLSQVAGRYRILRAIEFLSGEQGEVPARYAEYFRVLLRRVAQRNPKPGRSRGGRHQAELLRRLKAVA